MSIGSPVVVLDAAEREQQWQYTPLSLIPSHGKSEDAFKEDLLQFVVHRCPEVLPVREFLRSQAPVISLGMEIPVDLGESEGRIDNLLVTVDGFPIVVETKLRRNPEATRDEVAQNLQYGMAMGRMTLLEIEGKIKAANPHLAGRATVRDCVVKLAGEGGDQLVANDFEEALERHLRRGEVLLLVVSDGIRVGVERITDWLNEQGNSTPFKFGLVELNIYSLEGRKLIVPRTLLRTREISRHVVTVDIQPSTDVAITAKVTDEFHNTAGGKVLESRSVKPAAAPLTKSSLLQMVVPEEARQSAANVIDQLQKFDQKGTGSYLNFGFEIDGDFHPLTYLGKRGVWVYPLKRDRDLLGREAMLELHREANRFGAFFRDHQLDDPNSNGGEVKYQALKDVPGFAAFLDQYRDRISSLLDGDVPTEGAGS